MNKSKIEREYYEQRELWERDLDPKRVKAKKISLMMPQDVRSVLDVGCGNGVITSMIKKPFVVGLDFAKTLLSQVNDHKILASIECIPIKSGKFDLVILTQVLEHLDDDTYDKATTEIKRIKPNYLLIGVPFDENIDLEVSKCSVCGNIFNINHHYRKFSDFWFNKEFPEYHPEKVEWGIGYHISPLQKID